jgi:hypothetical protein
VNLYGTTGAPGWVLVKNDESVGYVSVGTIDTLAEGGKKATFSDGGSAAFDSGPSSEFRPGASVDGTFRLKAGKRKPGKIKLTDTDGNLLTNSNKPITIKDKKAIVGPGLSAADYATCAGSSRPLRPGAAPDAN